MTEENKDSKKEEVKPSSEESTDKNKPDNTKVEDTTQKIEVEEENKELKEKLAKSEKKSSDWEKAFYKEKSKPKELAPEVPQPEEETTEYDKDIDTRIDKKLRERDVSTYNENLKLAIQDIHNEYPEYKPENDINNINWDKLEPLIKATAFPNDRKEMFKRIQILHRGITQPISPTQPDPGDKVDDSGVGDVPTSPEGKDKEPDIMTRPLNKWEQKAYEIGKSSGIYKTEKDYREKLAKEQK